MGEMLRSICEKFGDGATINWQKNVIVLVTCLVSALHPCDLSLLVTFNPNNTKTENNFEQPSIRKHLMKSI